MDTEMERFIRYNSSTIDDFEDIKKLADYIGVKPETVILYRIQKNLDEMRYSLRDIAEIAEHQSENSD